MRIWKIVRLKDRTTFTSASLNTHDQSLQTLIKTQTQLNDLTPSTTKFSKVATYSELQKYYQHQFDEFTKLVQCMESHVLYQITSLERLVDVCINGLAQRGREPQTNWDTSSDGRPVCFSCSMSVHYHNTCPQ